MNDYGNLHIDPACIMHACIYSDFTHRSINPIASSLGRDTYALLWEEWLHSNGDWNRSSYVTSLQKTSATETMGCRRWMTKNDILKKYDGNQEHCDAIITAKETCPTLSKTHIKPHPDAPQCAVACRNWLTWSSL